MTTEDMDCQTCGTVRTFRRLELTAGTDSGRVRAGQKLVMWVCSECRRTMPDGDGVSLLVLAKPPVGP